MSKKVQPALGGNAALKTKPKLKLYNSLTREKDVFVPNDGNRVYWYSCGPTVYDSSHMGHARSYITFDILRRVLTNYFSYDVVYVMNITDIDDKIIKRARQNYLYEEYCDILKNSADRGDSLLVWKWDILCDLANVVRYLEERMKKGNIPSYFRKWIGNVKSSSDVVNNAANLDDEQLSKILLDMKEPLMEYLDGRYSHLADDNEIFAQLPRHWENEFHEDMKALNVLKPDKLTRVSEYVPEIVEYIRVIVDKGLAYVSTGGSVYFDVTAFDSNPDHNYAKLMPQAYGDTKCLQEGEGVLSGESSDKKSPVDFALWKASKAGEPWWPSPWGNGRPGWHIECSVMASKVCGQHLDIHTGGVDLKFPHHDNELAQSEAYFGHDNWVGYFLHSGHLTISGCKMSKSLKNFITIREALTKYTARQLRVAFLQRPWHAGLDYSEATMEMAAAYDKLLNEFFLTCKSVVEGRNANEDFAGKFVEFADDDWSLWEFFHDQRAAIHAHLCDNVNTPGVLNSIKALTSKCHVYLRNRTEADANAFLIEIIAKYVTKIAAVLGLVSDEAPIGFPVKIGAGDEAHFEETSMAILNCLADFRHKVRQLARVANCKEILEECDELRDEILPNLNVRLEDGEGRSSIKIIDKETLAKEREEKARLEDAKKLENERREREKLEKEASKAIPPDEFFRKQTDKYSKFDEKGIPTHDIRGNEIGANLRKKLRKTYNQREKIYEEYKKKSQF